MTADEETLRAAARELIAAGRSLLDAAEAVLDDPDATERVVAVMSTIAQQAQKFTTDALDGMGRRGDAT